MGLLLAAAMAFQATPAQAATPLERFLPKVAPSDLFPGADSFGPIDNESNLAPILRTGETLGYAFLNSDFVNAGGYSGKPIHVVVGLDLQAQITGARLVNHSEPIVLVGIPEQDIRDVIDGYAGVDVAAFARGSTKDHEVDIVSGATVTIMVIDDSILRAAIKVARRMGLGGLEPEAKGLAGPRWEVDPEITETADWETLLGNGAVRRLTLSVGDINQAFAETGDAKAADRPESADPNDSFIDLHAAVVSIPAIGRSILGEGEYRNLQKKLKPGQQAILLAASGLYSFKGSGYVRGGIFDRFHVIQGDDSFRFRDRNHKRLGAVVADGAPRFTEVDLFYLPVDGEFDAARDWRVELLVARATGATE